MINAEVAPVFMQTATSTYSEVGADLMHGPRPRPLRCPDSRDRPLLAEAGLILEVQADLLVGMGRFKRLDLIGDDLLRDRLIELTEEPGSGRIGWGGLLDRG
jgi:hypothetical protein